MTDSVTELLGTSSRRLRQYMRFTVGQALNPTSSLENRLWNSSTPMSFLVSGSFTSTFISLFASAPSLIRNLVTPFNRIKPLSWFIFGCVIKIPTGAMSYVALWVHFYLTLIISPLAPYIHITVSVRFFPFHLEFLRSTRAAYRTVVHNVLVGSVSFASPAKALHNASTAQEITVISPSAHNLSFRVSFILFTNISLINPSQRWHDPSPMPPSPIPESMALPASPAPSTPASTSSWGSSKSPRRSNSPREQNGKARGHPTNGASSPCHRNRSPSQSRTPSPSGHSPSSALLSPGKRSDRVQVITFDPLSNKSFRTAFILNRFTVNATILYCSNDLLISTTDAIGRSFYDFVTEKDEDKVRSWIQCVKGWGVNEKGQPSDGGFGFGRFSLLSESRDSVYDF